MFGSLVFFILDHNFEAKRGDRRDDPVNKKSPHIIFHDIRASKYEIGPAECAERLNNMIMI